MKPLKYTKNKLKVLASPITDEAEFLKAALAVEQEAVEVSIGAALAIASGYKLALLDFMD